MQLPRRFAPAGFSQMIDGQKLEAVWIPYYTMRLTVISSFKSKVLVSPPAPATQDEAVRTLYELAKPVFLIKPRLGFSAAETKEGREQGNICE